MNLESLQPNVQELKEDVIDLLNDISALMGRASTELESDDGKKNREFQEFQQEIARKANDVKNLELRMAVVAPMKAGKSTITNAIIGQEILPSRNAAMTTLPTEIIFQADLAEPVLILSPQILSVFQDTILDLRHQINLLGGIEKAQEKTAQYPQLKELLETLKSIGFSNHNKTNGCKEIIKTLTHLNDIIRLCSLLELSRDPLQLLSDCPRIFTPFSRAQKTEQMQALGNLVIVDTPGPNEAGQNTRLQSVVAEQLRKSSIVLIVLDFTQLKTKAAEEVKQEVQKVMKLRGKENLKNLYVLVNKVDQRADNDMNTEQVRQFVAAELGIGDAGDTDRVFEISARRAFYASNFQWEIQQNPGIDILQMKTAETLAKQAFGDMWEIMFNTTSVAQMQLAYQYVWDKSGFAPFLEKAINALMKSAAPKSMESALNIAQIRMEDLNGYVQMRAKGIAEDEAKLRLGVGILEKDLARLESCRNQLREVDKIKTQLSQELHKILETVKKQSRVSIESFFDREEFEQANILKKVGIGFSKVVNYLQQKDYKGSGTIEFNSLAEAEDFTNSAISYPTEKANILLEDFRKKIADTIEYSRQELINQISRETKPIIEEANQRLKQNFNLDLSLPIPRLGSVDISFVKPQIETQTKWVDQGYDTKLVEKREWWHWLWIVPLKETIKVKRPDQKQDYYTVSLREIVDKVNDSMEKNIKDINQGINHYLKDDFQQRIDLFFNDLDRYLSNYRDSLIQAQQDKTLSHNQQVRLVEELKSLAVEANQKIEAIKKNLNRVKSLLPTKR